MLLSESNAVRIKSFPFVHCFLEERRHKIEIKYLLFGRERIKRKLQDDKLLIHFYFPIIFLFKTYVKQN